jgi:hypothetical protein
VGIEKEPLLAGGYSQRTLPLRDLERTINLISGHAFRPASEEFARLSYFVKSCKKEI